MASLLGDAVNDDTMPAAPRKGGSRDPRLFVLLRELSEVHLLLDNVSANPNTTVSELTTGSVPPELGKDWVEKICEISWPPEGSDTDRADDAALLIRVKDYLNSLVRPASGSTIAFTLLVTQEDWEKGVWWKRVLRRDGDAKSRQSPTRRSLAKAAYPDLIGKAETFRVWMFTISIILLIVLGFTCALSWYVAYGNATLAEYAAADLNVRNADKRVNEAEAAEDAPVALTDEAAPRAAVVPRAAPSRAASAQPTAFVPYCRRGAYSNASQMQACDARLLAMSERERIERRLAAWLRTLPFIGGWLAEDGAPTLADANRDAPARAAALANIMGSAVLPLLYGLLGAGAAIVRSLSRKIRASLLSPRDLPLALQQLALGAVIGACIGLFVAAPGGDKAGESLLGPVTLSASAISFVAGFGVEAAFQALEALIARIFNLAPPPVSGRGDGS